MKRVAIYVRVSTSKQDADNQHRELKAVGERSGWQIVRVFEDAGISGAKGRDKRPGLDAMMKAVNAKEFDMIAAWSVDRLGRSLTDLLAILQSLQEKGVLPRSRQVPDRPQLLQLGSPCAIRAAPRARSPEVLRGSG
jgi:DNA invertase Pin-like site-specific DNA recombinase